MKKRTLAKIIGAGILATTAALLIKAALGEAEQSIVGGFMFATGRSTVAGSP